MHALKQTQLAAKALPHVARMLSSHRAASNGTYTPRAALELFAYILRAMAESKRAGGCGQQFANHATSGRLFERIAHAFIQINCARRTGDQQNRHASPLSQHFLTPMCCIRRWLRT